MRILRDQSGQTVTITAAFMALLALGFLAFALDAGTLFRQKRMAQAAADAAALAAAEELSYGDSSNEQAVANAMATANGFNTSATKNPATVTLSSPSTGNFTGSSYVEATVSEPISTFFLGGFASKFSNMTVEASAIAGGSQTSQTCVCLEGGSGEVLNMSNNSKLNATGCGVVADSTSSNAIGIVGGSTLTALSVAAAASSWDNSSNINNGGSISSSNIMSGISSTCHPTMPAAPSYSTCLSDPGGSSSSFTAGPSTASGVVCYTSLTVGANGSSDTLNPGTYVITSGNLHFESGSGGHANLGGQGVFFYLTGTATLQIDNGANVNLVAGGQTTSTGGTAPTVGSYNGILVYQASGDTTAMNLQGGSSTYMNGSLYLPSASLTIGNGSGAVVDGAIAASSLTMNGGGTLNATTSTNEGSESIGGVPKLVQ